MHKPRGWILGRGRIQAINPECLLENSACENYRLLQGMKENEWTRPKFLFLEQQQQNQTKLTDTVNYQNVQTLNKFSRAENHLFKTLPSKNRTTTTSLILNSLLKERWSISFKLYKRKKTSYCKCTIYRITSKTNQGDTENTKIRLTSNWTANPLE